MNFNNKKSPLKKQKFAFSSNKERESEIRRRDNFNFFHHLFFLISKKFPSFFFGCILLFRAYFNLKLTTHKKKRAQLFFFVTFNFTHIPIFGKKNAKKNLIESNEWHYNTTTTTKNCSCSYMCVCVLDNKNKLLSTKNVNKRGENFNELDFFFGKKKWNFHILDFFSLRSNKINQFEKK